jgi:hypothetical protein
VRSAIDVSCFHFVEIFEHLRRLSMPFFSLSDALRATPQLSKRRNPFKEVFGRRLFCEFALAADKAPCFWPRGFACGKASRKDAKPRRSEEEGEMTGMQTKETEETGRRRLWGRP